MGARFGLTFLVSKCPPRPRGGEPSAKDTAGMPIFVRPARAGVSPPPGSLAPSPYCPPRPRGGEPDLAYIAKQ